MRYTDNDFLFEWKKEFFNLQKKQLTKITSSSLRVKITPHSVSREGDQWVWGLLKIT